MQPSLRPILINTLFLYFMMMMPVAVRPLEIKKETAVEGKTASLPCDFHHPADDSVFLILWFNDNLTTPIYSYDMRPGAGRTHWVDETVLGTRASLDVKKTPAKLHISGIRASDAGHYKCRVDFRRQPTKTTRVSLSVFVPPKAVYVMSNEGKVTSVVGPYREGDTTSLTCISKGGWPRPRVLWYQDGHLIDDQMDELKESNILDEGPNNPEPLTISNTFLQGPTRISPHLRASRNIKLHPPSNRNIKLQPPKNRILKGVKKNSRAAVSSQTVENTLTLGPFTREDLKKLVTCEASNTNMTAPKSAPVMIDMNLEPLSVQLYGPEEPLSYGKQYEVVCEVIGSRPPPTITWWKAAVRVQGARETTTSDGNMTTSMLTLTPTPSDDGTTMTCRAENPATNTVLEQSLPVTVYYVPETFVSLGSSLDPRNIKEGDDVYFECSIQANPRSYKVIWKHNNKELQHNISGGVIVSNQSLVLQRVTRKHGGRYTCIASNIEGDGTAKAVTLDIKYAPVCAPGQVLTYGVARHEDAEVTCRVAANPPAQDFKWTFNNTADTIDVPPGRFTSTPTYSIITYTPMTELDYGTLLCWAENAIGQQNLPCVFHIVPAGKPDPPANCSVTNQTSASFAVYCQKGFDGGLHQIFFLRVAQPGTTGHTLSRGDPVFQVDELTPDTTYRLQVWASNDKGSSPSVHLRAFTTHPPTHHHTSHVAEVREGSSGEGGNSGSGGSEDDGGDLYMGVSLLGDEGGVPALLSVVVGAAVGVLLLVFLLILLVRHRLRRPTLPPPSHPPVHSVLPTSPQPILKNAHESSHACADREMQVESESEVEPDLIPQTLSQAGLQPGFTPSDQLQPTIASSGQLQSGLTASGPLLMPPPNYGGMEPAFPDTQVVGGHAAPPGSGVVGRRGGGGAGGVVIGAAAAASMTSSHHPSSSSFHQQQQHIGGMAPPTPHYEKHLLPKQHLHQHEIANDPRYAHLDLDEGGGHHQVLVPSTPKSRLVPTVYATLDTRRSHSRVRFDLRGAHSQVSLDHDQREGQSQAGRGHDLVYPQRGSSVTSGSHNPLGDPTCEQVYNHHLPHSHDQCRSIMDDDPTPETPLVAKRESSV